MTPSGPFRISYSGFQRQRIRELGKRAASAGRREDFLAALTHVTTQLTSNPIAFGDQTHTLQGMGLPIYTRIYSIIIVRYGVDVSKRTVYLQSIDLFPTDLGA